LTASFLEAPVSQIPALQLLQRLGKTLQGDVWVRNRRASAQAMAGMSQFLVPIEGTLLV
jgi:hypothetical protein